MSVKEIKEPKLSAPVSLLAGRLRKSFTEAFETPTSNNVLDFTPEQLSVLLEGYTTKLTSGDEVPVTPQDIEKVSNFREDFREAQRYVSIDSAFDLFGKDEAADRFLLETNLTPGLKFANSIYRPGTNEANGDEYTAVTDHGDISKDSKAISAHLKSLRGSFLDK